MYMYIYTYIYIHTRTSKYLHVYMYTTHIYICAHTRYLLKTRWDLCLLYTCVLTWFCTPLILAQSCCWTSCWRRWLLLLPQAFSARKTRFHKLFAAHVCQKSRKHAQYERESACARKRERASARAGERARERARECVCACVCLQWVCVSVCVSVWDTRPYKNKV